MRKYYYFLFVAAGLIISLLSACNTLKNTITYDKGVIINGVKWATRNVSELGTFASTPEDNGNYYTWKDAQCACPKGWRLPTLSELASLVELDSKWNYKKKGREFISGDNTLFLPAAGYRLNGNNGVLNSEGQYANYWSSTPSINGLNSFYLHSYGSQIYLAISINRTNGYSVRCVKK